MSALLTILRVLLQTLIEAGVAFQAGKKHAQDQQKKTDEEAAADALAAKDDVSGDRSELIDRLRASGNLRQ